MRILRLLSPALVLACGSPPSKSDSSVALYRSCEAPSDCVDQPEGAEAACLDKGGLGFCTWECTTDEDCAGETDPDWPMVCASFESNAGSFCFPACQEEETETASCPGALSCRSTGGGSDNRRVCFPSDGSTTP